MRRPFTIFMMFLNMAVFAMPFATPSAYAEQLNWNRDKQGYYSIYTFSWKDFAGQPQTLKFKVENDKTDQAHETDKTFLLDEALDIKFEKAQREARIRSTSGVSVVPYRMRNGNINYQYSGDTNRARAIIESVERRANSAMEDYLQQKNYRLKSNGRIESDYQTMARDNFLEMRPLARAIQKATRGMSMRETMNYTLSFLQSIPYETISPAQGDRGNYIFNSPLTLISDNKGDCDEKSLAFGTLMRLLYPNLKMGIILVPGHAFVAMKMDSEKGDMILPVGNDQYVVAEPVGPAYMPVGQIHQNSQYKLQAGGAQFREIPTRF